MEGDRLCRCTVQSVGISIHSLRMEGDAVRGNQWWLYDISIHSLRMEGDPQWEII